ncbi:MAG: HPP family protein [Gammaproteobacteria bacterium]|jgi:CBS-domain-containing membrane protein
MKELLKFIGLEPSTTSHTEKWVSAVGGFIGVLLTIVICNYVLGSEAYLVVASLGASAVLVFALPHVNVTQPWSLVGGQVISGLVGVTCARYIPDIAMATSAAVGLAILFMYYLGCIHPPGGATAVAAVIGGPELQAMGYHYVMTPILVNAVMILILAIVINFAFRWRRYPVYLMRRLIKDRMHQLQVSSLFTSDDLRQAMKQLDLYVDVNEEDLARLVNLSVHNYQQSHLLPSQIRLARYYSNGLDGDRLEVRQIIDESPSSDAARDRVIYKVVSHQRQSTGSEVITRVQFAKWARYEVTKTDDGWKNVE